jgi:parallel beta-helix repeat protein
MAQERPQKISELSEQTVALLSSDLVPVVSGGVTRKATVGEVRGEAGLAVASSGVINAATLQAAMTALSARGGGTLLIPPGVFPITLAGGSSGAPITWPDGVYLKGAGMHVSVLDFSGSTDYSYGTGMFLMQGAGRSNVQSVTATVARGAVMCTVASGAGYAPNDIVQLRSTENYVIDDGGTRAEFLRVQWVDGNDVYFTTPTVEPYDIGLGTVQLANISFVTGGMSDLTVKGKGINPIGAPTPTYTGTIEVNDATSASRSDICLRAIWARDLVFLRCRFVAVENQPIILESCYGVEVGGNSFEFDSIKERSQYGVGVYRCTANVRIHDNFCINCRHFVTTGSTGGTGQDYWFGVPNNITVTGNMVLGSWQSGIDMHRSGYNCVIDSNVVQGYWGGIKVRAQKATVTNNAVYGPNPASDQANYDAIQIFYDCNDITVSGNKTYGYACGLRLDAMEADGENIVIQGNSFSDCGAHGIRITTGAFTLRRLKIDGNLVDTPTSVGISLNGNLQDASVIGNTINGGTHGIRTLAGATVSGLTVNGNIIRGTANESLYLEDVTGLTCQGNQTFGANTNGVHIRIRDCIRGTVTGNYSELPVGATGGNGIYINCSGSGSCQDLNVVNNSGYAPTSVGTGVTFDAQANQFHYIEGNTFRTFATSVGTTSEPTIRNLDVQRQSLTIASDAVTCPHGLRLLQVDTEGGAATDNLATISYSGREGDRVGIRIANSARDVVVKDGTGNLQIAGDCTLGTTNDSITLEWRGSSWVEVSRSING